MTISLMSAGEPRPPHVFFEERSVEDREQSIATGAVKMTSVDYVIVQQPGSKDTVEKEAKIWLEAAKHNPNFPPVWVDRFHAQYKLWKEGHEPTPDGTHVRMWAAVTKAEAETLINAGIKTVEDLAAANEEALRRVGIGARSLQQKARAWVEAAAKTGATAEEITQLRVMNEAQQKQIEDLREKIRKLAQAQGQTDKTSVEETDDFLK